ncbi:MAG TPA: SBBP repeat-containing protein [Edaphocola sp.]|nr:SBBP repeat-containing protein [Edaphocola sp.]
MRNWVSYFARDTTNISSIHYDSVNNCIYTAGATMDITGVATPNTFKSIYSPSYFGIYPSNSDMDAFISKWDLDGNLLWSTYYGGKEKEYSPKIKTDKNGNIYVLGYTESDSGIVTPNAYLSNFLKYSYYLTKFDAQGNRLWATYICLSDSVFADGFWTVGNGLGDNANPNYQLDIDTTGNIYIGFTTAYQKEIGTPGTHKPNRNAPKVITNSNGTTTSYYFDIALVKYDTNGNKLWGTFYGGSNNEYFTNLFLGKDGFVYIVGRTGSDTGIATSNAYMASFPNNGQSFFMTKFTPSGQRIWGTYLALPLPSYIAGFTGDEEGNIYLSGYTMGIDNLIATPGTYQQNKKGPEDVFLLKFNNLGFKIWGTYLGGDQIDRTGIYSTISNTNESATATLNYYDGFLYLAGSTTDSSGWNASCGYATQYGNKGFFAKMDTAGQKVWTSLYDAPVYDLAIVPGSAQKRNSELYFVGKTTFSNLATPGAFKETKDSYSQSLIGKMTDEYDCNSIQLDLLLGNGVLKTNSGYNQYFWYHNGNLLASTTDTQYVITDTTGIYWVQIEKCTCTVLSDSVIFSTTGIKDKDRSSQIQITPNPASEQIQINFNNNFNEPISIQIFDYTGKLKWEAQEIQPKNGQIKLSISTLPPGLYLLKIKGTFGSTIKKLIKKE